ncbi:hypothetical protein OAJ04_04900 [Candidatus Nitrosopelagicus sp.]|nr:hypothetical protein [Candidatus Nitrosopelagicus sp.]
MIGMDDSERNYDIVHMIKKIALAIEKKNTKDLQAIAQELEAWEPRDNWDDMDVRTKVFVEHVLVGLARIRLGLDVLDKGASELTEIREEVEEKEMNDAVRNSLDEDDYAATKTGFSCFKCGQSKVGKAVLEDKAGNKMCGRCARALGRESYDELVREYDELKEENFDLAQKITTENIDRFTRRNLSSVDEEAKFTCERCGILKRKSAPGVNNYKEVGGHKICGRCYRAFENWFEKTNPEDWDALLWNLWVGRGINRWSKKNNRASDGGPIDKTKIQDFIRRLMRDHSKPNGQIDWDKFHKTRRKMEEEEKKDRHNKERYRKDELSDEDKEDLK